MNNSQKYLLIPSVPTPNGRLHLGHIGGPYLSADIMARSLRRAGHQALIMTGTDSFDSYMTLQASKERTQPECVANHYHQQIAEDLAAMQINVQEFVNPLAASWKNIYKSWHHKLFQELQLSGATSRHAELIAWDPSHQHYLVGCWLKGNCPLCSANVTGYFCEECGAHFKPEEVRQQHTPLQTVTENIYLQLPAASQLAQFGVNKSIAAIYQQFLTHQKHLLRLSANSNWGLRIPNMERTFFNYAFIYAYFLMLGEIAAEEFGLEENVLAKESKVKTIVSFGIDNAVPFLASVLGVTAACDQYKPVDHYLINYFYHLNGSKFSTSRRHAIWVNDLIQHEKANSDVIRLYLAGIDVRAQKGDVHEAEMIRFYNQTLNWVDRLVLQPLTNITNKRRFSCDAHLMHRLEHFLLMQENVLQPEHFLPHIASNLIHDCVQLGNELEVNSDNYFWWLKTIAILTYPFMPQLSQALWFSLGYIGIPTIHQFASHPLLLLQRKISYSVSPFNSYSYPLYKAGA